MGVLITTDFQGFLGSVLAQAGNDKEMIKEHLDVVKSIFDVAAANDAGTNDEWLEVRPDFNIGKLIDSVINTIRKNFGKQADKTENAELSGNDKATDIEDITDISHEKEAKNLLNEELK